MLEQLSPFILYCWILVVFLSPSVRGQVRVVGASEPVTAHVGGDVVLLCRCDMPVDLTPLTVEWSRAELRPHPSDRLKRVPFVHVYTDHRDDDPDMKIPEFTNRTQLFLGELSAGVASLHIRNVALSDNGTYKCFIPNLPTQRSLRWTQVTLRVDDSDAVTTTTTTHAPELDPKLQDSTPDNDPSTPTGRSPVPKIVMFSSFGVVLLMMILFCIWPGAEKQPMKANGSAQEANGSAQEANGSAQEANGSAQKAVQPIGLDLTDVCWEDEKMLVSRTNES